MRVVGLFLLHVMVHDAELDCEMMATRLQGQMGNGVVSNRSADGTEGEPRREGRVRRRPQSTRLGEVQAVARSGTPAPDEAVA